MKPVGLCSQPLGSNAWKSHSEGEAEKHHPPTSACTHIHTLLPTVRRGHNGGESTQTASLPVSLHRNAESPGKGTEGINVNFTPSILQKSHKNNSINADKSAQPSKLNTDSIRCTWRVWGPRVVNAAPRKLRREGHISKAQKSNRHGSNKIFLISCGRTVLDTILT